MKKNPVIPLMLVFAMIISMGASPAMTLTPEESDATLKSKVVEVYYFHRNRRCGPCRTIENLTKKTMETYFTSEMENGKVVFHIVNVEREEQREIAQKFNVVSTALYLNVKEGANEDPTNMTAFAYRFVNNEDRFLTGLKEQIDKGLGKQ